MKNKFLTMNFLTKLLLVACIFMAGCKRWKMTEGGADTPLDAPKYTVELNEQTINNPVAK